MMCDVLCMQRVVDSLRGLFDKYVSKVLEFRGRRCRELVPTGELNAVSSLCHLLDALATPTNGVRKPLEIRTFLRILC